MSAEKIKNLKKEIELKTQYFNNIFDSINNGILIFNEKGKLLIYNLFFTSIFPKPKNKYTSLSFQEIFQVKNDSLPDLKEFSESEDHELSLINDNKTSVMCRFSKIENPESSEKEVAVIFTDLTVTKQAAREKAELQNKLIEGAYREGVAENAVAVLHNIGNVLTAIIGKISDNQSLNDFMGVLKVLSNIKTKEIDVDEFMGALEQELKAAAENFKNDFNFVNEKSSHIADVIAAQQRYANLKQEIKSSISLRSLISDCLLMHEDKILKRKIDIVLHDSEEINIFVEKNGMAQTLSNIIVNASEAIEEAIIKNMMSEGRIDIRIFVEGKMAVLKVSDNGPGVKKENIDKIFDYGFSTKKRESGFGLHNCANFIKRSGGSMEIVNNPDCGASVIIKVPRAQEGEDKLPDCA